MNKSMRLLMAGWLWMIPLAGQAETRLPVGSAGEVTLNWQKFNEMWTKMQDLEKKITDLEKPEDRPPVSFTITKAAYKGLVAASKINMTAVFELDIYEPKEWVKIPFLPSNVAVTEARLDGEPVGVVQDGGFHQLVIKKHGRHVLRVDFSLKAPRAEEAPQFSMNVQQTPMTVIALEFPKPKLDVAIEPAQGIETHSGDQRTLVTAALPPTSYINVSWHQAVAEENAGPAKLYLENQQLITVSEGTLKSHWALNYSILRKGVQQIQLQVPDTWNVLAVNCDGMQEWKIVEGSKGPELMIQLAYARRGTLGIYIDAEKGLGEKEDPRASGTPVEARRSLQEVGRDVIEIPRLVPLNVEREQGTLGIEAKGAVELQVQNTVGLHAIDPKELPGGLWQAATQPILFAFRYTKPYALALSVTRHPEVAVLSTTIDDANGITVITPRGQMITKIHYQVRNQLKQFLAVQLPKGSELWSAFVAGEPVKPTQAKDGSYRIPLAKSQLGDQGQQGFPVELIVYRSVPRFLPIGYRAMALPMPDAPVSRMLWSLYLPEKYRFPYFGGDVEKGQMAQPLRAFTGAFMGNRIDRVASASVSELNRKMKAELKQLARGMGGAKSAAVVDEIATRQSEIAGELFAMKDEAPKMAGIFPVAFELPVSGQLFNFGQVMIVGQDPVVSLVYVHARIVQILGLLLLGFLAMLLFRSRAALVRLFQINVARIRALKPA